MLDYFWKVRLKLGEGLVGLSLEKFLVINEANRRDHPNFKLIKGIIEEKFEAFLAVPILGDVLRIGVLVVQREKRETFSERDIVALRAVASQMGNMLELSRLFYNDRHFTHPRASTQLKTENLPPLFKDKIASEEEQY